MTTDHEVLMHALELSEKCEKLEARIEALEADLQQCTAQLEENTAIMNMAHARIEALEAALRETDLMVGALWADLFNKDMVKPGADWFFDKWRDRMKEIARDALDKDAIN